MSYGIDDPDGWLGIPLYLDQNSQKRSGRSARSAAEAFGGNLPDLTAATLAEAHPAAASGRASEEPAPERGILVIGLGDEDRGDRAIGLHLLSYLERMDWPVDVRFCRADRNVHHLADRFRHVIVLDAIEGSAAPGSIYQAGPEELMQVAKEPTFGLGLLAMLSPSARRRLTVFGVHPATTGWGSSMSADVLSSVPIALSFLRARILNIALEGNSSN